ncbi:permease [bacterium]|nr:permease [candidate division CSSED10-310 bacterium]
MFVPTLIMGLIAGGLFFYGYTQENQQHVEGLKIAFNLTWQIFPLLIFAFITAGMIQVLLPADLLSKWIGAESGIKGILIGTIAGGFSPGGPYVSLPIAAGLLKAGAGYGTMVAYLTGWSLWAINRIPMEVGILGWRLTAIRLVCTFFFPPIAGILANLLFAQSQ